MKKNGKLLMESRKIGNLVANISSIVSRRSQIAQGLGQSYGTARDMYKSLGYNKNPDFKTYYNHYARNSIAKRIINAFPDACWYIHPKVIDEGVPGKQTPFETAWEELAINKRIFHYFQRADKLASIGEFGALFLGLDDGKSLTTPLGKAKDILYLQPYGQNKITVETWNTNIRDSRYGLPEIYSLTQEGSYSEPGRMALRVHHSRIIHVAEDLLDSDVIGIPRLQAVLNMLQNLETVAGSSGEMFWRGAFPGLVFNADADAQMDADQGLDKIEEEIDKYIHEFQRHLKLQGIEVTELTPKLMSPEKFVETYLDLISGATGIPKRILIGSERGELASTQDETAWNNRVLERQKNFCEHLILRPFIDKMMKTGILPEVKKYTIQWQRLFEPTEKEKAESSKLRVEALSAYVMAMGVEKVVPVEIFLEKYLGFTKDEIATAKELAKTAKPVNPHLSAQPGSNENVEKSKKSEKER